MLVSNYGTFRSLLDHFKPDLKRNKRSTAWIAFMHLPNSTTAYAVLYSGLYARDKIMPYLVEQKEGQLCKFNNASDKCFLMKVTSMEAALKQIDFDKWQKEPFALIECERDEKSWARKCGACKEALSFKRCFELNSSWSVNFDRVDMSKNDLLQYQSMLNDSIDVPESAEQPSPDNAIFTLEGLSNAISIIDRTSKLHVSDAYLVLRVNERFYLTNSFASVVIPIKGIYHKSERPLCEGWLLEFKSFPDSLKDIKQSLTGKILVTEEINPDVEFLKRALEKVEAQINEFQKEQENNFSYHTLVTRKEELLTQIAELSNRPTYKVCTECLSDTTRLSVLGSDGFATLLGERGRLLYDITSQEHFTPTLYMPDLKTGLRAAGTQAEHKLLELGKKKRLINEEAFLKLELEKSEGKGFPRLATYRAYVQLGATRSKERYEVGVFEMCYVGKSFEMYLSQINALTSNLSLGDMYILTDKGVFVKFQNFELNEYWLPTPDAE